MSYLIFQMLGNYVLALLFQTLERLSPMIERDECSAATETNNMQKSRFRNILPANRFRPHLLTPVEGCNDFINAVFLPVSFTLVHVTFLQTGSMFIEL